MRLWTLFSLALSAAAVLATPKPSSKVLPRNWLSDWFGGFFDGDKIPSEDNQKVSQDRTYCIYWPCYNVCSEKASAAAKQYVTPEIEKLSGDAMSNHHPTPEFVKEAIRSGRLASDRALFQCIQPQTCAHTDGRCAEFQPGVQYTFGPEIWKRDF